MTLSALKIFFLFIPLLFPIVHGAFKELNVGLAEVLCNSSCSFFDPLIWENEMVPEDDDDVLILYTASTNQPLTINLCSPIALSNLDIEGNVALYVNASSFAVKNIKLIGVGYTSQIQVNISEVYMRNLVVNNAYFLSTGSDITLDYVLVTNESMVILVDTDFYCVECHLGDTTVDEQSTFTGVDATLWSPQSTFHGFTNITNLVIESRGVFYDAYLYNVTIQLNANIFAHGILQIEQLNLIELSMVVVYNATYVNIATLPESRILGHGSFLFTLTSNFSFGNPDVETDLTSTELQLFESNVGTFSNVAFGIVLVNAPQDVVMLDMRKVTFTQDTVLYGNITASGLSVQKSLQVIGSITGEGGVTSIAGQLTSIQFEQIGGEIEISGSLTVYQPISFASISMNTLGPSIINGNTSFTNSTLRLSQPLSLIGDWVSDSTTELIFPALSSNLPPRLNISGDLYINSTLTFAISNIPSSRTEYALFTYGGQFKGSFISNWTTPSTTKGEFSIQYTNGSISLVYTPRSKKTPFFSPGLPLYGAIAGITVLVVVLIIGAVVIKRMFTKQRRQYEVIPS